MSQQQQLFETEPAAWEMDAREQRLVATVVLSEGPVGEFDYLVPEKFCDESLGDRLLEAGRRLQVPFGRSNRSVVGYCVCLETKSVDSRQLKWVAGVIDSASLLSPAMLRLTRWMADYYLCPWGQVLGAVVPAGVRRLAGTRQVTLLQVPPDVAEHLGEQQLSSKQQRRALEVLAASGRSLTMAQLADEAGCTASPIKQLLKKGLVEGFTKRVANGEVDDLVPEKFCDE